jgi:hypothetical protein
MRSAIIILDSHRFEKVNDFLRFVFTCIISHYHKYLMLLSENDDVAVPFLDNFQHLVEAFL